MRRSIVAAALSVAIWIPMAATSEETPVPNPGCVVEIPIPGGPGGTIRKGLDVGPDGTVWFTQLELNQIASYDPDTGQFAFYTIPSPNTGPHSVAVDAGGDVWFTEIFGQRIGVLDPDTGSFEEFTPPTPISMPYGMAIAMNGDVWFTEMAAVKIARYRPSTGRFQEFPMNPATDSAANIAVDHQTGFIWVTELDTGKLARLNPSTGNIVHYDLPDTGTPHSVDVDEAGRPWYTDIEGNAIGVLNPPTGEFREFTIPTADATSHGVVIDSRRLLVWFTELRGNKVGVLNPVRPRFIEGPVPTPDSLPYFVAQARNGEIWFTEGEAPNIGHLPCTRY
jgi:streptogramin lyase